MDGWIGLLQKNPLKRLNWPHLLEHPFVRETEADRDQQRIEKSHFLQCGGFGGPRERLEVIMVRRAEQGSCCYPQIRSDKKNLRLLPLLHSSLSLSLHHVSLLACFLP